MTGPRPTLRCPCDGAHQRVTFRYDSPPEGETRFDLGDSYQREYRRCGICGHWFARHDLDLFSLYQGAYADATYGNRMRAVFDRIMSLPAERSDNAGRVARIVDFARFHLPPLERPPRLLDVGAGLAVFPARIKAAGWDCVALDPDPVATKHAAVVAGVTAVTADFMTADLGFLGRFEAITLNKVLEHVEDPVRMLTCAMPLLEPHGFLYVEVPDAAAAVDGPGREEFFIEHHHVFSPASLAMTAGRAGFTVVDLACLREPSGKFTIRAFLAPGMERLS